MAKSEVVLSKPIIVGVDDGHDGIKIYAGINPLTNEPIQFHMPARGKAGTPNMGDQDKVDEERISVGGTIYTVAPNLTSFADTRTETYPTSDLNAALVYQALRLAKLHSNTLYIATGLPVNRFYGGVNRSINRELTQAKKANLLDRDDVFNIYDEKKEISRINIKDHDIYCEAHAAFWDFVITDNGVYSELGREFKDYGAIVLDIGGRTTDCITINPGGLNLDSERSNTIDLGVLNLRERICGAVKAKFDISIINEKMMDQAIQTGIYGFGNRQQDITDIVNQSKESLIDELSPFIERNVRDGDGVRGVIVVGGGSELLKDQLISRFPDTDIVFPEHPVFANARGFYKMRRFIKAQK